MGVAVVAVVDISEHGSEIRLLSFLYQFVVPALCTHFRRSGEEELEFGIREHDRAYVAAVHDDAFGFTHSLLLCDQVRAYFFDLRDAAGAVTRFECTDLRFDIFPVERHMLRSVHEDEADLDVRQGRNDVCRLGEVMTKRVEPDGTVHSSGVHVGVAGVLGKRFGNC